MGGKDLPTRGMVLSLYRRLLRVSRGMPTRNRREYVVRKTQIEFRDHRSETDPERIQFLITLGETQLETAEIQQKHLNDLYQDNAVHFVERNVDRGEEK